MGSYINLTVGGYSIDWGKNDAFCDHGTLFAADDLTSVPYAYVEDDGSPITALGEAACRPLSMVVNRLELLGYTVSAATRSLSSVIHDVNSSDSLQPLALAAALQQLAVASLPEDSEVSTAAFHSRLAASICHVQTSSRHDTDSRSIDWEIADALGRVDPYAILRLLAVNPANSDMAVCWRFADVIEGGWVTRETIVDSLGQTPSFLVVTEGHLDSLIIEQSLRWLRPDVASFFRFIDMREGYPFTGTGNLYRFCQGLQKIQIENRLIIVYDNDTAGVAQFRRTRDLHLTPNFGIMTLPDHPSFRNFDTVGPSGEAKTNINGRAAAIECYLDLDWSSAASPRVRWGGYNTSTRTYQGVLIDKERYAKRFLKLKDRPQEYDVSKLEAIVDDLITVAISVAASPHRERAN